MKTRAHVPAAVKRAYGLLRIVHAAGGIWGLSARKQFANNASTAGWHVDWATQDVGEKQDDNDVWRLLESTAPSSTGFRDKEASPNALFEVRSAPGQARALGTYVRNMHKESRAQFGTGLEHRGDIAECDRYSWFYSVNRAKNPVRIVSEVTTCAMEALGPSGANSIGWSDELTQSYASGVPTICQRVGWHERYSEMGKASAARDGYTADGRSVAATAMGKAYKVNFTYDEVIDITARKDRVPNDEEMYMARNTTELRELCRENYINWQTCGTKPRMSHALSMKIEYWNLFESDDGDDDLAAGLHPLGDVQGTSWTVEHDEARERDYYFNYKTEESVWEMPDEVATALGALDQSAA